LKIFDSQPENRKLYIILSFIAWIPITVYTFFSHPISPFPSNVIASEIIDSLILWFSFQLSLLCLMYVIIETFRRYLNKTGKMWNEVTQNSYSVYIIHVIVLGVIALVMLNMAIVSLLKFLILAFSTFLVSNLISSLYRQVATSRRATN
jgi:hypothetical protein